MNDQPLLLDRYRLIERLAVGGSAEVWRAHDAQLDRMVAVKRLHPHLLPDEFSRLRLAAEARAAASLSHPVIVDVYDVDATGESAALIMELVDGESLGARLAREGPMPERTAASLAADLADALYHAHQRGVIHRDVKPGNVLIGADGRTRLVDFGIAHSLADASERLTLTGTVIGTPSAMAPEQLVGGAITPRTDLYGLGVVLFEALAGRPPYPPTPPVALAALQKAGPPHLDGVDPVLAGLADACLAHDPADRPLHAGALATALREWLAGDTTLASGVAPVDPAAVTQLVRVARPVPAARQRMVETAARSRTPRWPLMAAALVLGLVLVGFVIAGLAQPGAAEVPTASATSSTEASGGASPEPAWLAGLQSKIDKQCGADAAAEAGPLLAVMSEEEATDHASAIADACKEAKRGNGKGNGNGNDDD